LFSPWYSCKITHVGVNQQSPTIYLYFWSPLLIHTQYYMSKSVSHAVSTREPYITPRTTGPRCDIGRWFIRHVIQILTGNVLYIIYFNHAFDNTCILCKFRIFRFFLKFLNFMQILNFFENLKLFKFWKYFEKFRKFMKFLKIFKFRGYTI
jgi:hypothetical protein